MGDSWFDIGEIPEMRMSMKQLISDLIKFDADKNATTPFPEYPKPILHTNEKANSAEEREVSPELDDVTVSKAVPSRKRKADEPNGVTTKYQERFSKGSVDSSERSPKRLKGNPLDDSSSKRVRDDIGR